MTVYARSDLSSVTLSAAHGGCGATHVRPAPGGKPGKIWGLDCPNGCEDHLRHDPLWSTTLSEIPETYDEQHAREDFEKRGAKDRDQVLALALAKLAGVELPESLLRPITGNLPHIPDRPMLCPDGHASPAGQKFCGECGAPMHGAANALEAPQAQASAHHTVPDTGDVPGPAGKKRRLRDERLDVLQQMAREKGLSDEGTRADLLDRLKAAPVAA